MYILSIKEIADVAGGKIARGNPDSEVRRFSTDSRTVESGDVFIAIKGDRFDGHKFVKDAAKKGARGVIIEDTCDLPLGLPDIIVITVKDTVKALGSIGGLCRNKFKGPVIAVTGSVGKTTTKEFISSVLEQKFNVYKTEGTLNNHIGVPLTLMGLDDKYDVGVLELGMSNMGEIDYLSGIARPDAGVITNIGPAHLEKLGSIENVVKAKAELLKNLPVNGLVVLNTDDEYFRDLRALAKCRVITVGRHHAADFQAIDVSINSGYFSRKDLAPVGKNGSDNKMFIAFKIIAKPFSDILEVNLPVIGVHNIYSALTAVAIGYGLGLGMDPSVIINSFTGIKLPKMRLESKEIAGMKIIDDSYNANPISMVSALETLSLLHSKGKKIFVCSDMLELGAFAEQYHKQLGRQVAGYKIDRLITIGNLSGIVSDTALECGIPKEFVRHCESNISAVEILSGWLEPGDIVLVKGSRARHMEDISKGIEEYYSTLEKLIV